MTLTLDFSRANVEIAVPQELFARWMQDRDRKEANQLDTGLSAWSCPLTTLTTVTLKFQGQSLKMPNIRNGRSNWHGKRVLWGHIYDHDIDLCVTLVGWVDVPDSDSGMTSAVGAPLTYLVCYVCKICLSLYTVILLCNNDQSWFMRSTCFNCALLQLFFQPKHIWEITWEKMVFIPKACQ